jgi:hypothetical protein
LCEQSEQIAEEAWGMGIRFGALAATLGIMIAGIVWSSPAYAQESTNYCYDSLGRLVEVSRTGGPNDGKAAATAYDPAGNRTNQTVADAASNCLALSGAVVPEAPPPPQGQTGNNGLIAITDDALNVLPQYTATYGCFSFSNFSTQYEYCWLKSNNVTVYILEDGTSQFDTGYSINQAKRLEVQTQYLGTGEEP